MNLKFWTTRKKKESKPKTIFQEWRDSIVFAVVVATLIRWSAVEAFVVPTGSMENTIMTGDFLFVSKFHYGSRTPATPLQVPLTHQTIWGTEIPSYLDWIGLPTYRFPGISKIKREDVIVFNVPPLSQNKGVEYPMDLKTFYVKRCVAIAGDRFEIRDKQAFANGVLLTNPQNMKFEYQMLAKDEINKRNLTGLEYFFLGHSPENLAVYELFLTKTQFNEIKSAPYVLSIKENELGTTDPIFGSSINKNWKRDNYGPLLIPAAGMKIKIDASTLALYGEIIKDYEHNTNVTIQNGKLK